MESSLAIPRVRSVQRWHGLIAFPIGLAFWLSANAAPPDNLPVSPDAPLTLPEASAAALLGNPEFESFNYALRATEAERIQAGLRPNPKLSIQFQDPTGTGNLRDARGLETTLLLSQVLELGGKRERRQRAAAMRLGLLEADYEILRLDVLAEVARRFVHVVRDQALLAVAREAVTLAERTRGAAQTRVAAARAPRTELSRAKIALARARIELEHREHELKSSRRALAASWGDLQPRFERAAADLFVLPTVGDFEQLTAQLRESPDLQRFLTERRLREAQLRLAQARGTPNAQVGAGVHRVEAFDDQGIMLTFSIGLPVFDRNQGNIAAAKERLTQIGSKRRARLIAAQTVLFATYQELLHARTEAQVLAETVIPEARQALDEITAGYRAGRFSYLELADARRELIQLQSEAITAAADYHRFLIEIERLTGLGFAKKTAGEMMP